MIALLVAAMALALAEPRPPNITSVPVSYVVSVVYYQGECRFLPTDVGLTAAELTATLRTYNRVNRVALVYYSGVPASCVELGRKAALAAGFQTVTARLAKSDDERNGRVPD